MKKRILALLMVGVLSVLTFTACGSESATSNGETTDGWTPDGPITMVAAASPGGGYDTSARNFAQALNETGIVDESIKVVNETGGGGQLAFTNFGINKTGDNHSLIAASTATITIGVANHWEVDYTNFTPLGKLVVDALSMVTASGNEEFDTIEEITAALQKDPKSIKFGAAPPPDPDYIGFMLYLQSIGVDIADIEYVVYEGGGEIIPALMGGHIDVGLSGVSEFGSAVTSGQVTPVAVAAEERLGGAYADTPTFIEEGVDLVYGNWRGIWGPKDMDPEAVAYYQEAIKQLAESDEWAEICENMQWEQEPMVDGYAEWVAEFQTEVTDAMKASGIIN